MGDHIRFADPPFQGGRHCLMCGSVTVGAVFPPFASESGRWRWRLFSFGANPSREGSAKDENTAKGHLISAFAITLADAGLTPITKEARNG